MGRSENTKVKFDTYFACSRHLSTDIKKSKIDFVLWIKLPT
jgi:hypothetical protein